MMDPVIREILVITQEEAAEVIQEISKIFRFGIDDKHRDGLSHRAKLTAEVGDLQCMIDLLIERGIVDAESVSLAVMAKRHKLEKYSDIFR